jgi:hypothetical protein
LTETAAQLDSRHSNVDEGLELSHPAADLEVGSFEPRNSAGADVFSGSIFFRQQARDLRQIRAPRDLTS